MVCFFGIVAIAAITSCAATASAVLLAPLAGIACGMAASRAVLRHHKLAATATWGEVVAEVEKIQGR